MEEKKKELFPYFAYLKSVELFPEKYGNVSSMDEWTSLIQENEDDINTIITASEELTDEDWGELEKQYSELQSQNEQEQAQFAAKGAKLKRLKEGVKKTEIAKKGTSMKKRKKCKCGCDMVISKAAGGKLTETCACKCGGQIKK